MDVRLLEGHVPNLEVRRMDLETDDLPEAAFDFVHTRFVLMHLPHAMCSAASPPPCAQVGCS